MRGVGCEGGGEDGGEGVEGCAVRWLVGGKWGGWGGTGWAKFRRVGRRKGRVWMGMGMGMGGLTVGAAGRILGWRIGGRRGRR